MQHKLTAYTCELGDRVPAALAVLLHVLGEQPVLQRRPWPLPPPLLQHQAADRVHPSPNSYLLINQQLADYLMASAASAGR